MKWHLGASSLGSSRSGHETDVRRGRRADEGQRWAASLTGKATVCIAALYVIGGLLVLFWPTRVDGSFRTELKGVLSRLHQKGLPTFIDYSSVEFLANMALFAPLGAFAAVALRAGMSWAVIPAAAVFSIVVEIVQWQLLPARVPDLHDVLANVGGATLGWACTLGARRAAISTPRTRD